MVLVKDSLCFEITAEVSVDKVYCLLNGTLSLVDVVNGQPLVFLLFRGEDFEINTCSHLHGVHTPVYV